MSPRSQEIVSPNDVEEDLHARVRFCLASCSRLVWVVWLRDCSGTVYSPEGVQELEPEESLSRADLLPGCGMEVSELFEVDS